jgi:uncharacterized protein (TIRG00374 family)
MNEAPKQNILISSRHRKLVIMSLMLAAALYLLVVMLTGYKQAINAFQAIGATGWLLLFSASFINYSLRYLRWQYYLKRAGWSLAHFLHFRYYLSAFALTTSPGKLGEIIRSVLLRPHGVPYHTSLACFFSERLLDLIVITIIALLGLLHFPDYALYILLFILVLLAVLPFLRSKHLLAKLVSQHHGMGNSWVARLTGHLIHLLRNAHIFLSPAPLYNGLLIGMFAWSIQGFAFFFIVQTLGHDIGLTIALAIYAVSLLAGAASFIPGGIGSTELVMGLLLIASGTDQSIAITAPLISRLSTLWFAVVVGLLAASSLGLHRYQPDVPPKG